MRPAKDRMTIGVLFLAPLLAGLLPWATASGQEAPEPRTPPSPPARNALPLVTLETGQDPGAFLDVDVRALADTAQAAYAAGRYEEAARLYLDLARTNITDGATIYNLACCYGLLGREQTAARFLARAWKAGYHDIAHIREDPDFNAVRGGSHFDALVDSLARTEAHEVFSGGTRIWIDAPVRLYMRVALPDGYTSSRSWPLVVGLHGRGGNPEQFMAVRERSGRNDFIFASLQAPYPMYVGGPALGYQWSMRDSLASAGAMELAMDYVADAVRALKERYAVGNVYVLGFSQGAHLALNLALHRPDLFDGIVVFGGWLEPADTLSLPHAPAGLPAVFIGHGRQDPVVPLQVGRKAGETLQRLGYRVETSWFEGQHTVDGPTLRAAFGSMVR